VHNKGQNHEKSHKKLVRRNSRSIFIVGATSSTSPSSRDIFILPTVEASTKKKHALAKKDLFNKRHEKVISTDMDGYILWRRFSDVREQFATKVSAIMTLQSKHRTQKVLSEHSERRKRHFRNVEKLNFCGFGARMISDVTRWRTQNCESGYLLSKMHSDSRVTMRDVCVRRCVSV